MENEVVGTAYFEDDDGYPVYGQAQLTRVNGCPEWICYTVRDNEYDRGFGIVATVRACWDAISLVYQDKGAYQPRSRMTADMPSPEGNSDG